ncbi:MAG TPA: hypothetical protein VFP98_04750 [Candidatus Polarisedimenticolia bacterium]|nr:hypothetical protein [Candidatus Polarisedimenticolia bacterium]
MTVTFTSYLSAAAAPLKHAWEHTVGSSRAVLALRADWQEQLQRCHDIVTRLMEIRLTDAPTRWTSIAF